MDGRRRAAEVLAAYHYVVEPDLKLIRAYTREGGDKPDDPIRLLEVHDTTIAAGIVPIYFGAATDVPFPSVVIEVNRMEFDAIEAGESGFQLPDGWDLGEDIEPPVV